MDGLSAALWAARSSERRQAIASFEAWLSGFIDGEGSFAIAKRHWRSGRTNYSPRFQLGLRDDDRDILYEIVERTGIGKVYVAHQRSVGRPQFRWTVVRKADCLVLIEILDRNPLRAKKALDYALWREAVLIWAKMEHVPRRPGGTGFEPGNWGRIPQIAEEIKEVRRYKEREVRS